MSEVFQLHFVNWKLEPKGHKLRDIFEAGRFKQIEQRWRVLFCSGCEVRVGVKATIQTVFNSLKGTGGCLKNTCRCLQNSGILQQRRKLSAVLPAPFSVAQVHRFYSNTTQTHTVFNPIQDYFIWVVCFQTTRNKCSCQQSLWSRCQAFRWESSIFSQCEQ